MQPNNSINITLFFSNNFGDYYVVCILEFPYFIALNLFSSVYNFPLTCISYF